VRAGDGFQVDAGSARLSDEPAEQAIVQRLFQASLEVHSAMSIARDERVLELLRRTVTLLDRSIKQVQSGALATADAEDDAVSASFGIISASETTPSTRQ
jgi:hypothetical protein